MMGRKPIEEKCREISMVAGMFLLIWVCETGNHGYLIHLVGTLASVPALHYTSRTPPLDESRNKCWHFNIYEQDKFESQLS